MKESACFSACTEVDPCAVREQTIILHNKLAPDYQSERISVIYNLISRIEIIKSVRHYITVDDVN